MNPSDHEHNQVAELINQLSKLPDAPTILPPPALDDLQLMTCACNKVKSAVEMPEIKGEFMTYRDNLCVGCEHMGRGLVTVICLKCRRVLMRFEPVKDPATGFRYEAGKVYHCDSCPTCIPGLTDSNIVEKLVYEQALHRRRSQT